MNDLAWQTIPVKRGQDVTVQARIFTRGVQVQLSADVVGGAAALPLKPDHPAIASGSKLLFGENIIATTTDACPPGDTSVTITALPGAGIILRANAYGRRMADLVGATLKFGVFEDGDEEEAAAFFTATVSLADDPDDANSPKAQVAEAAVTAANTALMDLKTYYFAIWRTNSGTKRPVSEGDFILEGAGALS